MAQVEENLQIRTSSEWQAIRCKLMQCLRVTERLKAVIVDDSSSNAFREHSRRVIEGLEKENEEVWLALTRDILVAQRSHEEMATELARVRVRLKELEQCQAQKIVDHDHELPAADHNVVKDKLRRSFAMPMDEDAGGTKDGMVDLDEKSYPPTEIESDDDVTHLIPDTVWPVDADATMAEAVTEIPSSYIDSIFELVVESQ